MAQVLFLAEDLLEICSSGSIVYPYKMVDFISIDLILKKSGVLTGGFLAIRKEFSVEIHYFGAVIAYYSRIRS